MGMGRRDLLLLDTSTRGIDSPAFRSEDEDVQDQTQAVSTVQARDVGVETIRPLIAPHDDDEDDDDARAPVRSDAGLDELLEFIRGGRGFDLTGYKRTSVTRRIRRRMQTVGIDSFPAYLAHLESHPDEFPQLFDMLLINVTAFYRDPTAWEALAARLPAIVDLKGERPIRIWSAGCSSGEEAYTLAILIAEAVGPEAFARRVKIYATDVDEDALNYGRQAKYGAKSLEALPPALLEKYFTGTGSQFSCHREPSSRRCLRPA